MNQQKQQQQRFASKHVGVVFELMIMRCVLSIIFFGYCLLHFHRSNTINLEIVMTRRTPTTTTHKYPNIW